MFRIFYTSPVSPVNTSQSQTQVPITSQPVSAFLGYNSMIGRIAFAKTPCSSCGGSK